MGKSYFQFKQFGVTQKRSAMKVGTDGVLLGAWTPLEAEVETVLDVGTGTGLIALMVAQRCPKAKVYGVESDKDAFEEACLNFLASPWGSRLYAINESFQQFASDVDIKFDWIVCNPPFFLDALRSRDLKKNMARHHDALSHQSILQGSESLLKPLGQLGLILPVKEYDFFRMKAARMGWFEQNRAMVKTLPEKPVKRVLSVWALQPNHQRQQEEIVLEERHHLYTPRFKSLTSLFYL